MVTAAAQAQAEGFGSLEEKMVYQELLRRRYKLGEDFTYQTSFLGGRLDKGGLVIDFLFYNPPGLAINPLGYYYHYLQGVQQRVDDRMSKAVLASFGITLVFIDAEDVHRDVRYYVGEALSFRDHSRHTRGIV